MSEPKLNQESPKIWASLGATVNTGNFNNTKIDIGISGIPIDADDKLLAEYLKQANSTIYKTVMNLAAELSERISDIREGATSEGNSF